MFEEIVSPTNEVELHDNSNAELRGFLEAIEHTSSSSPTSFSKSLPIIQLLMKYGCNDEAKVLLFTSSVNLGSDRHFEAFVIASQLGDYKSGCHILSQGHQYWAGKVIDGTWQCPTYSKPSLYSRMPERSWTMSDFNQVDPLWREALASAFITKKYVLGEPSTKRKREYRPSADMEAAEFWKVLMGKFMSEVFKLSSCRKCQ